MLCTRLYHILSHISMYDNDNMVQPVYYLPVHTTQQNSYKPYIILNLIITAPRIAIFDDFYAIRKAA